MTDLRSFGKCGFVRQSTEVIATIHTATILSAISYKHHVTQDSPLHNVAYDSSYRGKHVYRSKIVAVLN
jgi:hypothetical protein